MKVVLIVTIASALPWLANTQCLQCPLNCSCSLKETVCSDLRELPQCLPHSSIILTISNSPHITQLRSNAFAHKSFAYLETIKISGAGFYDIEDFAFNGTRWIQSIEITNTDGPTILTRYTLFGLDSLLSFEASGIKNLQSIGYRAFSTTPNLKTLKLQENNIKFIDSQSLESVFGLEYFDISNNHYLPSIPQTLLSHIGTLKTIHMNDCSLSTIYTDYFYTSYMTNALQEFRSNGNDWDCDQDLMCSFVNWISGHPDFVNMATMGYCQTPIILFGFPLRDLDNSDVCDSSDARATFYMYATVASACIVFLAVCASIYRRRHSLCCCRNCHGGYTYIDDNHFDIDAHDRAAVRCPNPPNYESVVAAPGFPKPEDELPPYDDYIAPPDYEE